MVWKCLDASLILKGSKDIRLSPGFSEVYQGVKSHCRQERKLSGKGFGSIGWTLSFLSVSWPRCHADVSFGLDPET